MRPSMLIGIGIVSSVVITSFWLAGFYVLVQSSGDTLLRTAVLTQFRTIGFTGAIMSLLVFAIHLLLLSAQEQRIQQEEAIQLKMLAREAELRALRTQIDPHFLFNSLNSISALALNDGKRTREMTVALSEYLRATLTQGSQDFVSLQDEGELVERYLSIEKIRLGNRLQVSIDISPATLQAQIPPLLLQPLVENSLRHGIASLIEGGMLTITAMMHNTDVIVEIKNPFDPSDRSARSRGMGQDNVRRRLAAAFPDLSHLSTAADERYYTVTLRFPFTSGGNLS